MVVDFVGWWDGYDVGVLWFDWVGFVGVVGGCFGGCVL